MTEQSILQIEQLIKEVRTFIEKDEPWKVPLNGELTEKEVMNSYAEFINYTNILSDHLKRVDLMIHILTKSKYGATSNTPSGQKAINQINAHIEMLKTLHKALDDIDSSHYLVGKYYEKGGGLF